jgi:HTH-type transcriptional regulator/antitoxin HigA
MTIKPIRTEEDYKAALAEISRLMDAREDTEDFDRLDVLATLVEAYEAKKCPIGPPSPLAAIEYEMEKRGLSHRDMESIFGSAGRVSEILNGQRPLTMTMIRRLQSQFDLSADVLIARYPLKRSVGRANRSPSSHLLEIAAK